MSTLKLKGALQKAFGAEFSATLLDYASASALFCETLLKIIDIDIHAVDLAAFLDSEILSCQKASDVQGFMKKHPSNILDTDRLERDWLQYYLPRVYVFLHTTTFSKMRLDRGSISVLFHELLASQGVQASILTKSVEAGEKQLNLFSTACKSEDWYYDIGAILEAIQEHAGTKVKQNTIPLFLTIMKGIEPKFMDDLRGNFGRRLGLSLMLGANEAN
jgi:hypothetical protein